MIDYQFEIKPLQDQGVSNQDIATHLNSKTAMPMSTESRYVLQDSGAVLVDPVSGEKFGSLISYYSTLQEGDAKNLIAFFLERIYSGQTVDTSAYPRSIQFTSVEASLPADLQAVCARLVDEAGGGRPNSGLTEADVLASQQAWEQSEADRIAQEEAAAAEAEAERIKQEQVMALENRYIASYNANIAPLIDGQEVDELVWKAAIESMAASFVPAE
jgi:hypothetical protein